MAIESEDAWKNPKERELKGLWGQFGNEAVAGQDAWKNPKERELKVEDCYCHYFRFNFRCMEKSQGTGIERCSC